MRFMYQVTHKSFLFPERKRKLLAARIVPSVALNPNFKNHIYTHNLQ